MRISEIRHSDLVFRRIKAEAKGFGLEVVDQDFERPWGGFLRFSEDCLPAFFDAYWTGADTGKAAGRRDPKVLLVAPAQRLSLQYHCRRSELWRVLDGPVAVVHGPDLEHLESDVLFTMQTIFIPCVHLHRLGSSSDSWGRVAEIWIHEDPENPSDEDDIVRVQDDYAR